MRRKARLWGVCLAGCYPKANLPAHLTILFIACSDAQDKSQDWAEAAAKRPIPRLCPACQKNSIWGHGRRRKQAHDAGHDWIDIRRGYCAPCHRSFTFLPSFSLPYTHYSVVARSQTVRRHFVERRVWEQSAPDLKSERCPDLRTLRRWCDCLDNSPGFRHLRRALESMAQTLRDGVRPWPGPWPLSWPTLAGALRVFFPLRL